MVKYDDQGRLLSIENYDERGQLKMCGTCSKLFVEYALSGEVKTILMQGADETGKAKRIRIDFVGNQVEYALIDDVGKVLETRTQMAEAVPIEILNLGRMRYSVDSNRRPTQIIVPIE